LCPTPGSLPDVQWAWRFAAKYVLGNMVAQESRGYGIPFVCSKEVLRPGVAPLEGLGQALSIGDRDRTGAPTQSLRPQCGAQVREAVSAS